MDVSVAILCYAAGSSMPPLTCLTDDDCSDSAVAGAPSPLPKFLLPLAGRTPLALLLEATAKAGIPRSRVHLLCSPDTRQEVESAVESMKSSHGHGTPPPAAASSETAAASSPSSSPLHLHTLSSACSGTASAVRHLSSLPSPESPSSPLVPPSHHLLVLPADVLLEDPATLPRLCNDHLSADPKAAATVLLRDVGAEDEEGRPIKESKKGKLGLLQREADKIDVVGLVKPAKGVPRLVLKRSRVEIDEGEENVGETPKLEVPKSMLRAALAGPSPGALSVRTDLLDLHCFVLSPWAWRSLLASKACKPMDSVQSEFLPHLIAAQQAPAAEAYGDAEGDGGAGAIPPSSVEGLALPAPADSFCVAASVLARPEKGKSAALHVRVNSVANYAYACREAVANGTFDPPRAPRPPGANARAGPQRSPAPPFASLAQPSARSCPAASSGTSPAP
jgi:hypothetical protein